MKIAILGYGKMGHEIEKAALKSGYTIGVIIDNETDWDQKAQELLNCDAAIDFSVPAVAVSNIYRCFGIGIPVVSGTTGWQKDLPAVTEACLRQNGTLFYASNFSIGVNIFFEISQRLAALLAPHPQYTAAMTEIHHIHKLDAPSGTAITLAEGITAAHPRYTGYSGPDNENPDLIPVTSLREGEVPGTHSVSWESPADRITLIHEAHNREGFAMGAVLAANWVKDRKGIYGMKDLLGGNQ
jgi:4-hydroxy-tetrahydrodipicolinate reductase